MIENKQSKTNDELAEFRNLIVEGFQLIKNSDGLSYSKKAEALDKILSVGATVGILPGWRPKAISHGALQLFVATEFKLPKGLERAHEFHRRHTIKALIEDDWLGEEWWDYFEKRDFTVLSTRSENRKEKEFEKVIKYPIPLELNLFHGKRVGFVYGESEKHFLIDLASRNEMVEL
jgi:hypothetical protein